jgi:hypothetical protein
MWRLGFFFHEIAFGLLSVFIPLYVVTPAIGGSLVDLGIMTSAALLFSIPALGLNNFLSSVVVLSLLMFAYSVIFVPC